MLSILIPVYNYDITKLVSTLHKQASATFANFEIIVMDDASTFFLDKNKKVKELKDCEYTLLDENIGRSAIRNRLADKARYNHLLFIDCDAEVIMPHFIEKYLSFCHEDAVVIGGTAYDENNDDARYSLRLKYGRKREALKAMDREKDGKFTHFSTFNFLISKHIFQKIRFDEAIKSYGHEDTLFGHQIAQNGFDMHHIDNPLLHTGLDDNKTFLKKTEIGTRNLYNLFLTGNYPFLRNQSKLLSSFEKITKRNMQGILAIAFVVLKPLLTLNLYSKNPSLRIFDAYKLLFLSAISK